jgi:hypothetical protein
MNKLSSPVRLFADAVRLVVTKIAPVAGISIAAVVLTVVFLFLLKTALGLSNSPVVTIVSAIVLLIVFIYYAIWAQLALMNTIISNTDFSGSFGATKDKVGKFFILSLITGLFVALGYILFIIPGIIWSVQYSFIAYVFLVEGLHGKEARNRSREYVKGYWWPVALRLLFWVVVYLILFMPIYIVAGKDSIVYRIYSYVVSFALGPISIAYSYLLYTNLKRIKQPAEVISEIPPVPPLV